MDYHVFKSALNNYFAGYVGRTQRPVFFDIDATYPPLNEVTRSYPHIRAELERLLRRRPPLPRYHDIDAGEAAISSTTEKNWNVFMLEILGHKPERNRALCPETCRALDRVPNLLQAFFSVLEPGKSIPRHEGPYLGYLRYHLALRVPKINPPKLCIDSHEYVWKPGEAVLFDDTWPHAVVNHSGDIRAVLVVDILRPMPPLPGLINKLTTHFVARYTYGRRVAQQVQQFAAINSPLVTTR